MDLYCMFHIFSAVTVWTGLTLLNGFSFLVIFYLFFFILGRAVD